MIPSYSGKLKAAPSVLLGKNCRRNKSELEKRGGRRNSRLNVYIRRKGVRKKSRESFPGNQRRRRRKKVHFFFFFLLPLYLASGTVSPSVSFFHDFLSLLPFRSRKKIPTKRWKRREEQAEEFSWRREKGREMVEEEDGRRAPLLLSLLLPPSIAFIPPFLSLTTAGDSFLPVQNSHTKRGKEEGGKSRKKK